MMKLFLRFLGLFAGIILLGILLLYIFNYEYILRGIDKIYLEGHTTAYLQDYKEFDNREIEAGTYQPLPKHKNYNTADPTQRLQETNEDLSTVAFLIFRNDSIWYEDYAEGFDMNTKSNSFSMAKSITVALLSKAIEDGYIENLDQPVTDFYPEFQNDKGYVLTVGDLASMASGLNWDEDYYDPFSVTARVYFDQNIREVILDLEVVEKPGTEFEYLSGNTLLLGMVLQKATGQTLSDYLSDNFWKPMGMRNDALWQLDSYESGLEKAYCCIASNARAFSRFGILFQNHGKWNNTQLLDSAFVAKATRPRFEDSPEYGYGFWLSDYRDKEIFYMRGMKGQYVISIPEDDLIIVRLGRELIKREEDEDHPPDVFIYIDETYKMLGDD